MYTDLYALLLRQTHGYAGGKNKRESFRRGIHTSIEMEKQTKKNDDRESKRKKKRDGQASLHTSESPSLIKKRRKTKIENKKNERKRGSEKKKRQNAKM